jgi:uracil-DNA glycosylase
MSKALEGRLSDLHQAIRACHRCFPQNDNCPVPGGGGIQDKGLFFIGQAPGIREPQAQKMFAWTAGKRLFQWLARVDIHEDQIRKYAYMTAVTKCFPGKASHGKGDRKPSIQEIENCSEYLKNALLMLKPKVIVTIGSLALNQMMPNAKFSDVIGLELHQEIISGKTWIIPLPHPSGASPWVYLHENQKKLTKALELLKYRLQQEHLYSFFVKSNP